jgi:hypothetical protein
VSLFNIVSQKFQRALNARRAMRPIGEGSWFKPETNQQRYEGPQRAIWWRALMERVFQGNVEF